MEYFTWKTNLPWLFFC